jgi:hypothetical protein
MFPAECPVIYFPGKEGDIPARGGTFLVLTREEGKECPPTVPLQRMGKYFL